MHRLVHDFLIGNDFVLVPQYDDEYDEMALQQVQEMFPEREVVGVPTREVVYGGGNIHCITQQQPVGVIKSEAPIRKDFPCPIRKDPARPWSSPSADNALGNTPDEQIRQVRFAAESQPFASAKACPPNVEDAYMYLMQEKRGERGCC